MLMSNEQRLFLKKQRKKRILVSVTQLSIVIIFFSIWEFLAKFNIINSFIFSSPSSIAKTFISLLKTGDLFMHIFTTLTETLIAFMLGITLGIIIAIILYSFQFLAKVFDPFLTLLNSLPKVALGPLIIIWIGANKNSIIFMALLINLIINIITIYNGFMDIDKNKIKLLLSLKASKTQILFKLIIPSSLNTIISSLKLNISMSLIGVIMGEFLVSKSGLGYLIMYGKQMFNLDLVMTSIIILIIISYLLYKIITILEKKLRKNKKPIF